MKQWKVIIAHPGKQHSFQLAYALQKKGMLCKYCTTVYDKDGSLTHKFLGLLKGKDEKKAKGRRDDRLRDSNIVQYCELESLILLMMMRIGIPQKCTFLLDKHIKKSFGIKVAKLAIREKADAVIIFDSNATECFRYLKHKAPEIKRVIDASIANRVLNKKIYEMDYKTTGDYAVIEEQAYLWDDQSYKYFLDENQLTQYVLAASNFVKNSYVYAGISPDKIYLVPYGVDVNKFNAKFHKNDTLPIRLLYVGGTIRRKGLHHLLSIITRFSPDKVHLDIVGQVSKDSTLFKQYPCQPNQVTIWGFVTRDKIADIYNNADIFVLPSLSEGMALVGLEAMASGLPLICTENTGVNDLIKNYNNGLIIKAMDEEDLFNAIDWFLKHMGQIEEMGYNARKSVESYSWENYYYNVVQNVLKILDGGETNDYQ